VLRKGTLSFQQKKSRPPLTRGQANYWLEMLRKILKVGTEFEIDLPAVENVLNHPDNQACVHANNPCVTDCINIETCLVDRHPTFCLTRSTGSFLGKPFACPAKDDADTSACQACPSWQLNCRGLKCAMFTPFCTICPTFSRGQLPVVENATRQADAEQVRREVNRLLNPSEFVGKVGKSGALEVKKDGSLHNGGIEVPTVGRRFHWNSFYSMCKGIIDPIVARGGYINDRCGQHFHILAGYFTENVNKAISELEQPMPEIILANFHQLCRRYELAMFWMTATGDDPNRLTRWAKFRIPVSRYSALHNKMRRVQEEMKQNIEKNGKYASVAYHFCRFDDENQVSTFHVENRIADGCLSPSVVTAWAAMIYSMVLKAVRLSQYGVLEVGDKDFVTQLAAVAPHLVNGQERPYGEERFADTRMLAPHFPFLTELSLELVSLLKSELIYHGPAYQILTALANKPVALRRIEGQSWEDIEKSLWNQPQPESPLGEEIREVVDLARVSDCPVQDEWVAEVAAMLGRAPEEVRDVVRGLTEAGAIRWSDPMGSFISA